MLTEVDFVAEPTEEAKEEVVVKEAQKMKGKKALFPYHYCIKPGH